MIDEFPRSDARTLVAARAARVGFGAVLIVGAVVAAHGAWHERDVLGYSIAAWFGVVWVAAFALGAVAWAIARLVPEGRADRLVEAGVVVPAIGLALMTPLTIHLPFALGIDDEAGFSTWVQVSIPITALAHFALAWLSARRVRKIVRGELAATVPAILGNVIVVSMVPFVVLYLIPPLLVALTGFAYLPILYLQGAIAEREHARLAALPPIARAL